MEAANDPFASISIAMAATLEQQGLQVIMFKELESLAPEEILADVELLREMSEAQLDNTAASATDPMGAVLSGFASFGQSLGPARTVGAFTDANCSIDVFS